MTSPALFPGSTVAAALTALALALGGCAVGPRVQPDTAPASSPGASLACADGEQAAVSDWLYFGAATPDGVVSADDWQAFLREVVTPRFPAGLTAFEASGQWQSADGRITREPSHVLNLLHAGSARSDGDVRAIAADYQRRFRQEAVLRVRQRACMSV